jgi:ribonuclease HI
MTIKVYTDGCILLNGTENSYGSWAYLILESGNHLHEESEFITGKTSNQAEFLGIIKALDYLYLNNKHTNKITIFTDSKYAISRVTNKPQPSYANLEYIKYIHSMLRFFPSIEFKWVKSHSALFGNEYNEYVDDLCNTTIEKHSNNG